ncbi:hypothetical protein DLJ49_18825 [Rhodovulum sp. 12E13]|uniref:FAD/NAD(P)-binding protein n=1 Tax=Rhodovulum sp. 12E13 TaxID=2203891 RepID=UPI000E168542|nr:FAD/NAD(P)-binding protein [Rhodovulum sp. 12E13]RDC69033.1 hypothetical protein DLJ49_18825 [Rhodovulum sp. 12E13]
MPRVLIAGGGFAGAALAVHLLRQARAPLAITVVEPRERLGAGLAYGTADPEHRINVPSDNMTVLAEAPRAFTDWLERTGRRQADPEGEDTSATEGRGRHYSRRADFGVFMADLVAEAAAQAPRGCRLEHVRDRVAGMRPAGDGAIVTLESGRALPADRAVLVTSHDRPVLPVAPAPGFLRHPGYHGDPWDTARLAGIPPDARVVVLGTGLTMVDVVTGLLARGHRGPIFALSRRGLLPRGHGAFGPVTAVPPESFPPTARAGLRLAREMVAREHAADRDWHLAVEGLRRSAEAIWQRWPVAEQARALHRLRSAWDVHRFRIAPQLAARLDAACRNGRLRIRAAALGGFSTAGEALEVDLRPRGAAPETLAADAVVNCMGPCADITRRDDPLLQGLFAAGLARPDPHRLGLDVDAAFRLRDRAGRPQHALRAVGPLTRGVFWEVVGVPELSAHCARLSEALLSEVAAPADRARA